MIERIALRGSQYAIIAVCTSIGFILHFVFLLRLITNPEVGEMLIKLFQNFPFPIIIGILSIFLSAYYFGKKAGYKLGRDIRLGSSIGLTTALKVLAVLAFSVSLTSVLQIIWDEGFDLLLSVYFLLRIAVPVFLLGLPFAFLMGYGFGMVLLKQTKKLQDITQTKGYQGVP